MKSVLNEFKQVVGLDLPDWKSALLPNENNINGSFCKLERLSFKEHARDLFSAYSLAPTFESWTYLPYGPFSNFEEYSTWLEMMSKKKDPYFYTVIDLNLNKPVGVIALMNIMSTTGSIEIGHVNFSPLLQKTIASTEAFYLLINYCFELGYRRCEWKCDHFNEPSRLAAKRLGFTFEGTFRQATIYKRRTRDTDWFSIIDSEWIELKNAFLSWLDQSNFNQDKIQKKSLDFYKGK